MVKLQCLNSEVVLRFLKSKNHVRSCARACEQASQKYNSSIMLRIITRSHYTRLSTEILISRK